jgi:iron complex transport system substrate-binding protein
MPRPRQNTLSRLAAIVLAFACIATVTACSTSNDNTAAADDKAAFPLTVHDGSSDVTIPNRPQRIVSLSPTATEDLFAVGAGNQVVAVDSLSTHPKEAPVTPLSGFTPNAEAVLAHKPDLVVVSYDANNIVSSLRSAGVPTLVEPSAASIDDAYDQIADLGKATGNSAGADDVVSSMRASIARAVQGTKLPAQPLSYYHEVDTTYFSVTSSTFLGQLYSLFGLQNIADSAGGATAFPQLSSEYIVTKNPNLVVLADTKCCTQNHTTVAARPGWEHLSAVTSGGVVEVDDDVASRWGPRIVDLVTAISDGIARTQRS